MRPIPPILSLLFALVLAPGAFAAEAVEDTLLVTGRVVHLGAATDTLGVGYFDEIFDDGGLAAIRKGFALGGDVYADGFKRAQLATVIDGERVCNACPNRMDAPVGRVNPLEIETATVRRDGDDLHGALGGVINLRRSRPAEVPTVRGYLSGAFHGGVETDAALAFEARGLRVGGRHFAGAGWADADGRTFRELYGYRVDATSRHGELSLHQARDDWSVHGSYAVSRDVLHPYLLMDERASDHWSVSFGRDDWRLYADHTDHLMDNGLRSSGGMTDMVTDASNTDLGFTGGWFELRARNWDADNRITPVLMPLMGTVNHMLPDVWRWGATVRHALAGPAGGRLYGRLGLVDTRAGDDAALDLNRRLHAGADRQQVSIPFAAGLRLENELGAGLSGGLLLEAVADAPGIEEMFIVVDKPAAKPTWIGNPDLADPRRGTLRGSLSGGVLRSEAFVTRVWGYPYLAQRAVGTDKYQTWQGEEVRLAGASLSARWPHLDVALDWQWGEKDDGTALGEIPPLQLVVVARTPVWRYWRGRLSWTRAAEQPRVDPALDETATPGWDRLDFALSLAAEGATLEIAVDNLADELYAEHLASWRQVFGAGTRVNAPGRTVRVSTTFRM